jgi:hypothetical protein
MRNKITWWALAGIVTAPMMIAGPAQASHRHHHYYQGSYRHYAHKCGGGNGAVGTVAGGVGGAVIGHAVGGGTAGTVLGGVGGALLGRHLDKQHTRHVNGC